MYPQTHIYFAERVLKRRSDIVTLGSILPDMIIGGEVGHLEAHSKGMELYRFARNNGDILELGRAVATHGHSPKGLDYYGDEKYQEFVRGYCFEKARAITEKTVDACNIPQTMGWWKAHNIIEMGIETIISAYDNYSERFESAMGNRGLIAWVDKTLQQMCGSREVDFISKVARFTGFIEKDRATAESLAKRFSRHMKLRFDANVDVEKVTDLIRAGAVLVEADLWDFFAVAEGLVRENIEELYGSV